MVGATGFEPATSCSQGRHSSQAEPRPDTFNNFFLYDNTKLKLKTFRLPTESDLEAAHRVASGDRRTL